MAAVIKRKIGGGAYYYLSHSYRAKEPGQKGKGRVKTKQIYRGTAEDVLPKISAMQVPSSLVTRSFGIEAAALPVIRKSDLIGIIDRHVATRRRNRRFAGFTCTRPSPAHRHSISVLRP
jgi:hypothetical protein